MSDTMTASMLQLLGMVAIIVALGVAVSWWLALALVGGVLVLTGVGLERQNR